MSAPLLVIGIDGLPPALLQRLITGGRTPVLEGLAEGGCCGILRSTPNYQSASAWTSLVTGVNPGRHGVLHFTNPVRDSYKTSQIDARACRAPTVWRILSEAGVRVAALNVPVSYPAEAVDGVMIAGWLCPSPSSDGFTHPPELARWLTEEVGDYPIHPDVRRHASAGRFDEVARVARRGIQVKLDVARGILVTERPEVMCVVVTETDSLQHWCWHLLDDAHPEHDPAASRRWRERLLSVYEALDEAVGALQAEAGGDADVLVVSDHGQAPNSGGQVLLRPWLIHAGYLVPRRRSTLRRVSDRAFGAGFEWLRRHAGNRAKSWLRARFPGLQSRAQAGRRGIAADWAHTRAWTEAGHIFVNTRGQWPAGCVAPGEDRDALLAEIEEGLLALRDADTGERAVAEITRGDQQFAGFEADLMPDLLVHWRHDLRIRRLIASDGAVIERPRAPEVPFGAHHPDGTLLACGPSFRKVTGAVRRSIYDIAPTMLHLLDQPVPAYFDGVVMSDLLTDDAAKDVTRTAVKPPFVERDRAASAGDEVVRRRLRSLGYME